MFRAALLLLFALPLVPPLSGQERASLSGQVVTDNGSLPNGLSVEVYDHINGGRLGRVEVALDGTFEFRSLPLGSFLLRLMGPHGNMIQETWVSPWPGPNEVRIHLKGPAGGTPVTATISARHLEHKVPSKAIRELREEEKAIHHGDLPGSIAHLRRALEIDPEYVEAHNNLGVRYISTGELDKAEAEFRKAAALDPAATQVLLNWASVLFNLERYVQAETQARQALIHEPASSRAHYVLGLTLLAERRSARECLRSLEAAAPDYPKAGALAAELRRQLAALSSNAGQPANGDGRQQ